MALDESLRIESRKASVAASAVIEFPISFAATAIKPDPIMVERDTIIR
jgi:hypothetical protein